MLTGHTQRISFSQRQQVLTIWLFGKNYLSQIQSLHGALRSHELKAQMSGWRHSLSHSLCFMALFSSDALVLWEESYSSTKSRS